MNHFKKALSVLLAVVIMFVGLPMTLSAEENEEYIFLSDIYYAYSSYISKSDVLDTYCDSSLDCMYITLDNYLNSDFFTDTQIKTAMQENPADIIDYIKLFLSGWAGKNYVESDAIDLANEIFLQNIICSNSAVTGVVGGVDTGVGWAERLDSLCGLYDDYAEWVETANATPAEAVTECCEKLKLSKAIKTFDSGLLENIKNDIIPDVDKISGMVSIGGDLLKLGKVIMLGVMIEDVRMSIISEIMEHGPKTGTFYEGMQKLNNDYIGGFSTYFMENYVVNGIFDKLSELVIDTISKEFFVNASMVVKVVGLIAEVAAVVLYPDTPALNDIMLQMVLTEYVSGMQSTVYAFDNKFEEGGFTGKDIEIHQQLMSALQSLTVIGLEKTKPLAVYSDDYYNTETLIYRYRDYDLYNGVISEVRRDLLNLDPTDRKRTYYDEWRIKDNISAAYGSDIIQDGKLYFTDGVFSGNVVVNTRKTFTIPQNRKLTIDGNLSLLYQSYGSEAAHFINNGDITVNGDYFGGSSYECHTTNNGNMNVRGNVSFGTFNMNKENTTLTVGGNLAGLKANSGTVILNGTEQQSLSGYNISCLNLTVLNKAGVKYNSDLYVSGTYLLNGNPLDNNEYYTCANSENVKFDSISDYKKISINAVLTIDNNVKGNIVVNGRNSLIIAENSNVVLDGDVTLNYQSYGSQAAGFTNYGNVTITGNFSGNASYECVTTNDGNMNVRGNATFGTLNMTEEDTTLTVGGNISGLKATAGTVILDGTEQQELTGNVIQCHNITVLNSAGIKYNSSLGVTGTYLLNGNPLDNNGYYTCANSANVKFDSISDYKKISINAVLTIDNNVKGNIVVNGRNSLIIGEDSTVLIEGDVKLNYQSYGSQAAGFTNYGNVTITGSFLGGESSECITTNNGNLTINGDAAISTLNMYEENAKITVKGNLSTGRTTVTKGDITVFGNAQFSNITVSKADSHLTVSGDLNITYGSSNSNTTLILNGTRLQSVSNIGTVKNLIIDNESIDGVVFNSAIKVNALFNHKGNNFTLYNNGNNSNFPDYDGDWQPDNKDDNPTVREGKYVCELLSDTNFDNNTNVLDFISIKKKITSNGIYDINLDGKADIGDVVFVKKTLLGVYDDSILDRL